MFNSKDKKVFFWVYYVICFIILVNLGKILDSFGLGVDTDSVEYLSTVICTIFLMYMPLWIIKNSSDSAK